VKGRLVICNEKDADDRARVTTDEEGVGFSQVGWIFQVSERSLYSMC